MNEFEVKGQFTYDGIVFTDAFPAHSLDAVKTLKFREDDVLVATYPKSGTTWVQEIVDVLLRDLNFDTVKKTDIDKRVPFLEVCPTDPADGVLPIERFKSATSPRLAKTHLSYKFFENSFQEVKPRCIVVMRNPKDVLVSYYHFYQSVSGFNNFPGTFDDYFELFKSKSLVHGDWADFNLSWWKLREDPKFLFLKYEDMKRDSVEEIKRIAHFLGKNVTSEEIEAVADHTSFKKMKENPMTNRSKRERLRDPFMRKGMVGDWKNYLSETHDKYMEEYLAERLKGTGLSFDY